MFDDYVDVWIPVGLKHAGMPRKVLSADVTAANWAGTSYCWATVRRWRRCDFKPWNIRDVKRSSQIRNSFYFSFEFEFGFVVFDIRFHFDRRPEKWSARHIINVCVWHVVCLMFGADRCIQCSRRLVYDCNSVSRTTSQHEALELTDKRRSLRDLWSSGFSSKLSTMTTVHTSPAATRSDMAYWTSRPWFSWNHSHHISSHHIWLNVLVCVCLRHAELGRWISWNFACRHCGRLSLSREVVMNGREQRFHTLNMMCVGKIFHWWLDREL